jgi:hypothetical protein
VNETSTLSISVTGEKEMKKQIIALLAASSLVTAQVSISVTSSFAEESGKHSGSDSHKASQNRGNITSQNRGNITYQNKGKITTQNKGKITTQNKNITTNKNVTINKNVTVNYNWHNTHFNKQLWANNHHWNTWGPHSAAYGGWSGWYGGWGYGELIAVSIAAGLLVGATIYYAWPDGSAYFVAANGGCYFSDPAGVVYAADPAACL